MAKEEKTYSVNEVADITGFTPRTIRNYIKNGSLTGKKIGSHWQFTEDDISNLCQIKKWRSKFEQAQFDFANELNTHESTLPRSCVITYYPTNKIIDEKKLIKEITKRIKPSKDFKHDLFFSYNDRKKQAEFILLGTNEQIKEMNEIIMNFLEK